MGSGASKELAQELKRKDAEIERLRKELEKVNSGDIAKAKSNTVSKASPTRSSMVGQSENLSPELFSKKQRRLEVSAEVMEHGDLALEYEKKVVKKSMEEESLIREAIKVNILFNGLGKEEKADCVDAFYREEYESGTEVIKQGDQGDNFYVVESGALDILVAAKGSPPIKFGEITKSMCFGELALLCNMPRAATIKAKTKVVVWVIERTKYREICTYYELKRREKSFKFLKGVPLLSKLNNTELEHIAQAMEWEEYEPGKTIIRQSEVGEDFYVIESGEVVVSKMENGVNSEVHRLHVGDYFGEQALLKDETRSATCTAFTKVTCLTLAREHFCAMLGSLEELMNREVPTTARNSSVSNVVDREKYQKDISMDDLEIMRTLGCGAFGRVKMVKHKSTGDTFAMKTLIKNVIVSNNLTEHVVNEKKVMQVLDHPFILKLHNTYKDAKYIHFLLELALGGELFTHLRQRGRFDESGSQFYSASVLLAFRHMHEQSIVYRDLKPENLILDSDGYLKVVDFGLAKKVVDRTWTLCGTPDYLAPEIILNKGHDKAVDYWALGVLIFELTAGFVPFYADDPMQVYHLILQGNIKFPSHFSRACCDLITKLLCQNPNRRLGNLKDGISDIMKQKWFSGFDWQNLIERNVDRPIVPKVKSNTDASNFEDFLEEKHVPPDCKWDPDF